MAVPERLREVCSAPSALLYMIGSLEVAQSYWLHLSAAAICLLVGGWVDSLCCFRYSAPIVHITVNYTGIGIRLLDDLIHALP